MESDNKFKIILTAVFGFFIIAGLLAFANYKSTNTSTSNVEVTVWGTIDKTLFDSYISKFKQDYTLEFNLTYTQKDFSTFDSELVEAIATGKAPDSILVSQELIKRYSDKVNYITSITERDFKDTYVQEAELYLDSEKKVFAIPFFIDPLVMYWNRDTFASAGVVNPPTKWSEFPLLVDKFTESNANANITKSLVSFGEYSNVDNAKAIISALLLQAGSKIVTVDNNGIYSASLYTKTSEDISIPAVSALTFYTDYSNPKKSVYSWNKSLPSSKQSFLAENLALYFGFSTEYSDIKEKNPNLNFDVAVIPQVVGATAKTTFGELYGFAFLKSGANIQEAYNVVSLLASPEGVKTFLSFTDVAPARRDLISAGTSDSALSVFYNSSLISKGWIDPDNAKTEKIFKDMVENVSTGRMSVSDSVQTANTVLGSLFNK